MYKTPVTEVRNSSQYVWDLCKSLQDAYALACDNLQAASFRQKELYDEKIDGKPYKVGDLAHSLLYDKCHLKPASNPT